MNDKVIYIVLGMHRSGTSLVANMIQSIGIPFGDTLIGPADDNEKGFWEDRDIVDLNERIFTQLGISWDCLGGFFYSEKDFSSKEFRDLKKEAKTLLERKFSCGNTWGFKDPRVSRLLPFWHSVIQDLNLEARYVLPFRTPSEVQASLGKRDGIADIKSGWLWLLYNLDALRFLQNKCWVLVDYESVLSNPKLVVKRVCEAFDIDLETLDPLVLDKFFNEFIEQKLQHHHNPDGPLSSHNQFADRTHKALTQFESSQISEDEFKSSVQSIHKELQEKSELNSLIEYFGIDEIEHKKETLQLQSKLAQQFDSYHQEEKNLINTIDELKESSDSRFLKIKAQEDVIEQLENDSKANIQAASDSLELQRTQSQSHVKKSERRHKQSLLKIDKLQTQLKQLQSLSDSLHQKLDVKRLAIKEKDEKTDLLRLEFDSNQQDLRNKIANQDQEFELEKKRLWDIVEKYRIRSVQKQSVLARGRDKVRSVTAKLLRIENGGDKSLFFLLKHRVKLSLKSLVYLLPKESKIRHHIMQTLIRIRCVLKGEVDGKSLRKGHNQIVRNRQQTPVVINDTDCMSWPDIDVSVVSHNNGRWITIFLESLVNQNFPISKISLTVVDNGSTDDTLDCWKVEKRRLGSQFKAFRIVENENLGFGEGHNTAFKHSSSPYVLVSNIDLEFTANAIKNVVGYAINDDDLVASWELRQQPFEHPKYYDPVSLETSWSSHACVLIRRACFEDVKGYEKRIFMYGEDVELSYRFRASGYKIKYFPKSVVSHYTYEEAAEVKPLQFSGSTLANSYIRLRYGTLVEILSIPGMHLKLLSADVGIPNARSVILNNIKKLLINAPYFLRTRLRNSTIFSFRSWDYEMIRDGSFYTSPTADCVDPGTTANKAPLVSVITRTYEGREYWLKEALASILNQTYTNIEIVIIEDGGSTMKALVDEFESRHKDVSFIYQSLPKKGRCYAGNQGLSLANGVYNLFLDDDDLLFCDHIETSVRELENDLELSAVYALSWDVETKLNGDSIDQGYVEMSHSTSDVLRQEFDRDTLQHHNYISIQSILFRRTLYEEHGGFDEALDNLEDWNLWVRYSSKATFKLIKKTTSMFRTPWDLIEKSQRQKILDTYYEKAVKKNKQFAMSQDD